MNSIQQVISAIKKLIGEVETLKLEVSELKKIKKAGRPKKTDDPTRDSSQDKT